MPWVDLPASRNRRVDHAADNPETGIGRRQVEALADEHRSRREAVDAATPRAVDLQQRGQTRVTDAREAALQRRAENPIGHLAPRGWAPCVDPSVLPKRAPSLDARRCGSPRRR